ncbi:MAG: class I SAM-dependent methyltransferase [Candidatus Hodarchaeales archaeon]
MENLPTNLAKSGALDIKRRLESISGGKILDVATQGGGFILTLKDFLLDYDSFIGIDISKKKWDEKQFTKYPVEFFEMNAESLDFNDSTFDTVCISHSVHHLSSVEKVFAEMKRVLKPNGFFLLQEMFCDEPQSDAQKSDIIQHHWSAEIDRLFGDSHYNTYTKREIRQIVTKFNPRKQIAFETTHYIKCLTCDNKFECDNPKNKAVIDFAIKEVDDDLHRLQKGLDQRAFENNSDIGRLFQEGKMIKKRIKQYGVSPASQLFIIGRN